MDSSEGTSLVDRRVSQAVDRVLRERLGEYGFEEATVTPGHDHDGEPVLFVDAYYRLSERPIDAHATYDLIRVLREALGALGETRFPHLRHHFDDRQQVVS